MPLMQKVLSLLMATVLLQVQANALSGGPVFSSGEGLNVIGTYSGVLIPQDVNDSVDLDIPTRGSSASIGLFSLGVPEAGPAIGSSVMFVDGTAFIGNITGVVDPGNGSFQAIIDAESTWTNVFRLDTDEDGEIDATVETNSFAQGSIDARLTTFSTGANGFATGVSSTRVAGSAAIDVFFRLNDDGTPDVTTTATYTVDGFKQSDTVSQVTFDFGQFDFQDITPIPTTTVLP